MTEQNRLLTEDETDAIIIRSGGSLNAVAVFARQAQDAKTRETTLSHLKSQIEQMGNPFNYEDECREYMAYSKAIYTVLAKLQ